MRALIVILVSAFVVMAAAADEKPVPAPGVCLNCDDKAPLLDATAQPAAPSAPVRPQQRLRSATVEVPMNVPVGSSESDVQTMTTLKVLGQ